jgi:protein SCO1
MFNRTTLLILLVAVATGAGLIAAEFAFDRRADTGPELQAVSLLSQPRQLPPFALRQSDRTELIPGELRGHWTCPDICPTTLAQLSQAQKRWETLPESTRPRVLFVSVDPERDTIEMIGEYAHGFHRDTLAATADIPALEKFATSLSLVFAKVPLRSGPSEDRPPIDGAPDRYTIDHSSAMVVLDPQGRMAGVIQAPFDPNAIAQDLLTLTETRR